jgi:hypothetical protein
LTKREQRLVILIVVALVAFAFAKHFWQTRMQPERTRSTPTVTPSPTMHPAEEQNDSGDDSR